MVEGTAVLIRINEIWLAIEPLGYTLKRWAALTRYLDGGSTNNRVENLIRPQDVGSQQLTVRRLTAQRSARRQHHEPDQSAKLNGLEPHAYLKGVLKRLPTQKASQIQKLLPQHWRSDD